jgi:ribosomal protein L11 methyltransferase
MPWLQISVTTPEHSANEISDLFSSLGAISVTYMDAADQPVYEPALGETRIWTDTRVIGLFELNTDPKLIEAVVTAQFNKHPLYNWQQETLQDQAWERTWMKYYQPMKFGQRLWVCPTGQEQFEPGSACLILDPGLAFGTGTHPTTALCLEWLESHDLTGKTVIDFSCGSGILAIAALLLGAKEAHAIDIDPQALTATQYNAEKNNIHSNIYCYLPEQFRDRHGEIVLANILAKPLMEMSAKLTEMLMPGGELILSGILKEQALEVAQNYSQYLKLNTPVCREDWCRLNGKKANTRN